MADLITTKAAFPKSGGLAVANGAVSVNAGNGLHVNPTTGMVEVPVDTTAGLGYGSNGLEVEVDGSTIDFNASGQLQALGGGGGDALKPFYTLMPTTEGVKIGNFTVKTPFGTVNSNKGFNGTTTFIEGFVGNSQDKDVILIRTINIPGMLTTQNTWTDLLYVTCSKSNMLVNGGKYTSNTSAANAATCIGCNDSSVTRLDTAIVVETTQNTVILSVKPTSGGYLYKAFINLLIEAS